MNQARDFIFIFSIYLINSTEVSSTFRFVYINATWEDAKMKCVDGGGQLAAPRNLREFVRQTDIKNKFVPNTDYWTGGKLQESEWHVYKVQSRKKTDEVISTDEITEYKGCFRSALIKGGFRLQNLNSRQCFVKCGWTNTIGLYSTMCLCEHHMWSLTTLPESSCDIQCAGCPDETCGGIRGVSVYRKYRKIVIVEDKTSPSGNCVYIQSTASNKTQMSSANCKTHLRYICRFDNHVFCGSKSHCFRPSFEPETWSNADAKCENLNGSLATTHIDEILQTGKFWIGIRRNANWFWTNGEYIPPAQISNWLVDGKSVKHMHGKCLVIHTSNAGDVRLAAKDCRSMNRFICQYNFLDERKSLVSTSIDLKVMTNKTGDKTYENTTDNGEDKEQERLLQSILYLGVGVVSGMAFVFALCIVAHMARRCRGSSDFKPKKSYRQKPEIIHQTEPVGEWRASAEVLYDVPADAHQRESAFRESQRIIQHGSWRGGADGYRSNSWKRSANGSWREERFKERPVMGCEILNVIPGQERDFGDTSYAIHKVQAEYHRRPREPNFVNIDPSYMGEIGEIDTRLRQPPRSSANDVYLADTYSFPPRQRQPSSPTQIDNSDIYACVQKVMSQLHDENEDHMISTV